ncbi:MAG TPA: YciI family protein [Gemmatimonadaceae bacterium]|nr:YciI family protein [Gemmatimonadaceae bacterium]
MHIADPQQIPQGIFAYTLHPNRLAMLTEGATPEERALAGAHWAYSQQLLIDGLLVFGGRTLVPTADSFALVVVRAPSLAAARAIAESDPAVKGGVFRAAVYPYQPMLMGAWPTEAATVQVPPAS